MAPGTRVAQGRTARGLGSPVAKAETGSVRSWLVAGPVPVTPRSSHAGREQPVHGVASALGGGVSRVAGGSLGRVSKHHVFRATRSQKAFDLGDGERGKTQEKDDLSLVEGPPTGLQVPPANSPVVGSSSFRQCVPSVLFVAPPRRGAAGAARTKILAVFPAVKNQTAGAKPCQPCLRFFSALHFWGMV